MAPPLAAPDTSDLPPHLSTGDPGSFAMRTITWRKPKIADQVLEANPLPGDARARVLALKDEMARGTVSDPFASCGLPEDDLARSFVPDERAAWRATIDGCRGRGWVGIPWYVAESMFYLRLLFATGWYDPRSPWFHRDPFEPMKHRELHGPGGGLEVARSLVRDTAGEGPVRERLATLLYAGLWGNRVDLSNFDIAEKERGNVLRRDSGAMLVDHVPGVVERLLATTRIDVLMDNCGAELVCDLALADCLLGRDAAVEVVLHVKASPFFVSDTMDKDARATIDALLLGSEADPGVAALGRRLAGALADGRLATRAHWFWNGPRHFVDLPDDLRRELARSDLVLVKGDANYRRLLSDRHWPAWRSMDELTGYFPAPFAAFRTMKSDVVVDIPAERVAELDRTAAGWRVDGSRGIVRLCRGGARPAGPPAAVDGD